MPWKTVTLKELADKFGINYVEQKEKSDLIKKIIKARKDQGLSQQELAKKIGISQPRIAKIESRIEAHEITFDTIFKILTVLGYSYKISTLKTLPKDIKGRKIAA